MASEQSDTGTQHERWFTRRREWSKKVVRNHGVTVYEKYYSPHTSLLASIIGAVVAIVFGLPFYFAISGARAHDTLLGSIAEGAEIMITAIPAGVSLLITLALLSSTIRWFRREFSGVSACDQCNRDVEHPHILRYRTLEPGLGFLNEDYEFCSRTCREAWERANRDYDDESAYDIQSRDDKEAYLDAREKEILEIERANSDDESAA